MHGKGTYMKKTYAIVVGLLVVAIVGVIDLFAGARSDSKKSDVVQETNLDICGALNANDPDPDELQTVFIEKHNLNLVEAPMKAIRFSDIEVEPEIVEEEPVVEEIVAETEAPKWVIDVSEEDYNNLLRIVEAEATGGDIKSKIMVANVIINRVKHSYFPNTVTEVVFQGNGQQFQPIADGRFYSVTIRETTVEAVNRALCGEDYSQGAYFFASSWLVNLGGWHAETLTRLCEYGGHVYFTF